MRARDLKKTSKPFSLTSYMNTSLLEPLSLCETQQLQPAQVAINPLPDMPLELYLKIFSGLYIKDFLSVTLVNRFFNSQPIWQGIVTFSFPAWNEKLALSKQPNIDFKSEYKHNLGKFALPSLYKSSTIEKIDSMYNKKNICFTTMLEISAMNKMQQIAIDNLLCFIVDNIPVMRMNMVSMFSRISFSDERKDMTMSALLKVALKKDDISILQKFSDVLIPEDEYEGTSAYDEKLAAIYNNLCNAGLISEMIETPKCMPLRYRM